MKIFQILAGILFMFFGASSAFAGGFGLVPESCKGAFSGLYGGGVIGFGELSTKAVVTTGEGATFKDNDKGFTIGGVSGYNVQCGNTLIGYESDFNYLGADTEPGISGCPSCGSLKFDSDLNWYSTIRGRLGYVADNGFLIYATGGFAYGSVDHSIRFTAFDVNKTQNDTSTGWTVGGGAEYLLSEHWSFRAEAMYIDFGSQSQSLTVGSPCTGSCTLRVDHDDSFWVARVGLTYLLGAPAAPVAYAPLK